MGKRKPINPSGRAGDFFKMKDLKTEVDLGRQYLKSDIPAVVYLYKIDHIQTQTDDLYGESYAEEKITKSVIELNVKFQIEEGETVFLGDNGISREYSGNLIFTIYTDELKEKNVDILKGDFVGIADEEGDMRFYEVFKNNKVNNANTNKIAGLASVYRKIECSPVDRDVFNG